MAMETWPQNGFKKAILWQFQAKTAGLKEHSQVLVLPRWGSAHHRERQPSSSTEQRFRLCQIHFYL